MMKTNDESMINLKTDEKALEALALSMPSWDDFIIEQYRKDPELAQMCVISEFKEFLNTGEICYLLSTLYEVAEARGWSNLAKETGLSRPTLYAVLSGDTDPKISTLMKILKAFGVKLYTRVAPLKANPSKRIVPSHGMAALKPNKPKVKATSRKPRGEAVR